MTWGTHNSSSHNGWHRATNVVSNDSNNLIRRSSTHTVAEPFRVSSCQNELFFSVSAFAKIKRYKYISNKLMIGKASFLHWKCDEIDVLCIQSGDEGIASVRSGSENEVMAFSQQQRKKKNDMKTIRIVRGNGHQCRKFDRKFMYL